MHVAHPMRHVLLCQVEALVGRAEVDSLALGDHHTLVLDRQGGVWACGENKEVGEGAQGSGVMGLVTIGCWHAWLQGVLIDGVPMLHVAETWLCFG